MAQLLLSENVPMLVDSDDEDMLANPDEVNNYKGMYQNEDDEPEQKYFEYGAHFSYDLLVERLEEIRQILSPSRRGEEKCTSVTNTITAASPPKGIFILIKDQNFRKANSTSKPHRDAANLSGDPGSVSNEKNFLFALGGVNKSRNVNHVDKETIYKPGTGVHIGGGYNNGLNALNFYAGVNLNQSHSNVANTGNVSHIANEGGRNAANNNIVINNAGNNAVITNKLAAANISRNNTKLNAGNPSTNTANNNQVNKIKISSTNKENKDARDISTNNTGVNANNAKGFNAYTSFTNDNNNQSHFLNQSQTNMSAKYNAANPASNNGVFKKSNAVILIEKKK
jgi:hypothetical protein